MYLIKIFEAFQHDTSKESMTIAFPGAGIAMLPKQILELIDKSASHLKTKIKFLISDFDSNYKQFLIKSNHLNDYLKHIKISSVVFKLGSPIVTNLNILINALSFSKYFLYSSQVVDATTFKSVSYTHLTLPTIYSV